MVQTVQFPAGKEVPRRSTWLVQGVESCNQYIHRSNVCVPSNYAGGTSDSAGHAAREADRGREANVADAAVAALGAVAGAVGWPQYQQLLGGLLRLLQRQAEGNKVRRAASAPTRGPCSTQVDLRHVVKVTPKDSCRSC